TVVVSPKVSIAHVMVRLAALKSAALSPLATASPPFFLLSATASCAGVAVGLPVPSKWAPRSFTTILAPCCAMRSACSRPMPRPEPVMIATLPSSNIEGLLWSETTCPARDGLSRQERRGYEGGPDAARAPLAQRRDRARHAGERARRSRLGPARHRLSRLPPRR